MARRIQVLPSALIDQIAAGEVVERPASVVKELVENSLDAGASSVFCHVEDGGRRLVQIVDDGEGMSREDVILAVRRHATSKIATTEDLARILTLGFRGEALPSIAAVSRLRILTRRREDAVASLLSMEGGGEPEITDAGAALGTEVQVADLFFNTPARRKFLRTPATEMGHIQGWITRLALMREDVHFRLVHGQRTLLEAPATGELAQRVAVVLGREVFEHLHAVSHEDGGLRITGLISAPSHSRPNARAIHLFVNGRFVRDRLLQHAVLEGYQTVLPQGRFPATVLRLDVDPAAIDVNVHPQKTEVRFADTRRVHQALVMAVGEVLARAPWMKAGRTYVLGGQQPPGREPASQGRAGRIREAMARFEGRTPRPGSPRIAPPPPAGQAGVSRTAAGEVPLSQWRLVGTLWNTYLLLASEGRLVVVDQHAAAERIAFERLRASVEAGSVKSQRLLVPMQVEVDGAALAALEDHREATAAMGFELEPFGTSTVNVAAVPALLSQAPVANLVRDVLDELADKGGSDRPWEEARLEVIGRMACHASVRAGQSLTEPEIRALLDQLDETDYAGTCPHGRPVLVEFPRSGVERWFART